MAEEINWGDLIPVKCDCCGLMTSDFLNKSEWWGKYLKPDEEKICFDCIKVREGYAEEYERLIGISVGEYEKIK